MKPFGELKYLTVGQLFARQSELHRIHTSEEVTEEVRHAAAVLLNLYGAELDARMEASK